MPNVSYLERVRYWVPYSSNVQVIGWFHYFIWIISHGLGRSIISANHGILAKFHILFPSWKCKEYPLCHLAFSWLPYHFRSACARVGTLVCWGNPPDCVVISPLAFVDLTVMGFPNCKTLWGTGLNCVLWSQSRVPNWWVSLPTTWQLLLSGYCFTNENTH